VVAIAASKNISDSLPQDRSADNVVIKEVVDFLQKVAAAKDLGRFPCRSVFESRDLEIVLGFSPMTDQVSIKLDRQPGQRMRSLQTLCLTLNLAAKESGQEPWTLVRAIWIQGG
jgi:hypothetical protein